MGPKHQRPELWNLYSGRIHAGESNRVFPLSNWTELDVWQYIGAEELEIPISVFAREREVFSGYDCLPPKSKLRIAVPESSPVAETLLVRLRREATTLGQLLRQADTVTALCHENPDGDTIGAAAAMARAAQQLGCRVEIVAVEGIPPAFAFLTDGLSVATSPTLEPGMAIVCDAATLDRVGRIVTECRSWFSRATIVNVDHHVTNSGFGALNLVDPEAAASCQVVAWLLPQIGVRMDAPIASAVLAGIIRDSHGFSTATTTPDTLRFAADAVEAGAALQAIYHTTLLEMPLIAMDLWGRLLSTLRRDAGGRIAWTLLTDRMVAETGTEQQNAEGVAEFIARATGVDIGILFRELGDRTRVSLRTSPAADAAAIAADFDGGGHNRRAGCTLECPAAAAIPQVLAACRRHLGV